MIHIAVFKVEMSKPILVVVYTDLRVSHLAPSQSDSHEQYPGEVQLPPFSQGGWQTAVNVCNHMRGGNIYKKNVKFMESKLLIYHVKNTSVSYSHTFIASISSPTRSTVALKIL